MWRMYCVCLLSVIVVLDLLGQSHVNRNVPSIESLAKNPLLLTMMVFVNRGGHLPTNRLQLYENQLD